jgi:hypothetical protein
MEREEGGGEREEEEGKGRAAVNCLTDVVVERDDEWGEGEGNCICDTDDRGDEWIDCVREGERARVTLPGCVCVSVSESSLGGEEGM